ncbi:aspartyl protease family protein [Palleronia aestuarii]|uniref:Aspartyl protease family protein n=1 Tax=Palleronia aestuarii TaxID=568105 RepID=A0A2W7NB01_9RHOB|nr:TIGR02281 family clan AA aspartic protease [Palleronia aestuarii]PZX17501.1 aspartyl protease family protein [Palleronia aestuarii]
MTGDSIASLLYLALLGAVIGGYFIASGRRNMGRTAQQAAIWGLIFVGAVAIAGLWSDLRDTVSPRQSLSLEGDVTLPRSRDGHYRMTLGIDGTPVEFIVDTGASDLVLSRSDAERVGLDPDSLAYLGQAQTANGTVPMARVYLDEVELAGAVERDVPASVNGGEMDMSLLGMSYLQHFGRIEISGNTLTLSR